MSTVTHGLILTVVGMSLVFIALGIFLLAMIILQRVFAEPGASPVEESAPAPTAPDRTAEKIAAIGVALSVWLSETRGDQDPQLGNALMQGPSFWSIRRWLARNVETFPFE